MTSGKKAVRREAGGGAVNERTGERSSKLADVTRAMEKAQEAVANSLSRCAQLGLARRLQGRSRL
jgi:hypothetical protein